MISVTMISIYTPNSGVIVNRSSPIIMPPSSIKAYRGFITTTPEFSFSFDFTEPLYEFLSSHSRFYITHERNYDKVINSFLVDGVESVKEGKFIIVTPKVSVYSSDIVRRLQKINQKTHSLMKESVRHGVTSMCDLGMLLLHSPYAEALLECRNPDDKMLFDLIELMFL